MKLLIRNPLGLSALVLILVAVLIPAAAYLGYKSNLANLDRMFYSKGSALMESVLHGAENALLADREILEETTDHLADIARYFLLLRRKGIPDRTALSSITRAAGLFRLDLYSPSGSLEVSNDPSIAPYQIPDELLEGYLENEEGVFSAFLPAADTSGKGSLAPKEELFAVGVLADDSSLAVVSIKAGELLDLRRRLGIGLILDDLSAVEGVSYAVLQDTLGIIAASSQVVSLGSIKGDPFFPIPGGEIKGRYLYFSGLEVYELAANFQLGGENYGYLRVGLSTEEIRSIAEVDRKRFVMGMIVLMVLLGVAAILYYAGRKQLLLEQEHSRIKSLSASVLEGMTEAVIVLDGEGRVILHNKACKQLCGCQDEELSGTRLDKLNKTLAKKIAGFPPDRMAVMETELVSTEERENIPVLISVTPLNIEGKLYSTIIIRDLTDRKAAEKLALRNEKFRTMAEVSAGVAHEIRNPLNAINMNVQRLKLEFTPPDEQRTEYGEFIDTILAEVQRINRIVEQFLTLARFPGPKMEPGRIGRLLQETLSFFEPELDAQGIRVKKAMSETGPFLFDPGQIRQVLTNLIQNAAESMTEGGTLTITGEPGGSVYRIGIRDTGTGIAEKDRERIFEPFFSTKRSGLGLGLAIVQRIVTEHGGTVSLTSKEGKGTEFIVLLPTKPHERLSA